MALAGVRPFSFKTGYKKSSSTFSKLFKLTRCNILKAVSSMES